MSTTVTPNGISYTLPDVLTANGGFGHATIVTAGTGDSLPTYFAIMADYLASAGRNMRSTSASSVAIGTGAKTFVLATDIPFVAGELGKAVDTANSANYMYFSVTSYTSATKTLVTSVASGDTGGSGTITSWNVFSVGQKGATGATGATYDIAASSAITSLSDSYVIALNDGANKKITVTNFLATIPDPINCQDNLLIRPEIKDYSETKQDVTAAATTVIDITDGNVIALAHGTNITTFTWNNPSPTGKACSFTLVRTKDASGTTRTIAWPAAVKWPGGVAPTLTQTTGCEDIFTFVTLDAGTKWHGSYSLDSR